MPTVSAHVAQTLARHVDHVFGVMGNGNAHFLDALERSTDVQYTAMRHEAGGVVAADAYFRASGRLAAATTLGGALTGVIGGLFYGAAAASGGASTVLVLTALVALLGTLAGAGIGLGMASAFAWRGRIDAVLIAGAMLGGMAIHHFTIKS